MVTELHSVGWIEQLIDESSFLLQSGSPGTGFGPEVVTGIAKIAGQAVALYAIEPSISRGYVSAEGARKICRLMEKAQKYHLPIIALLHSPGIELACGLHSGDEFTRVINKVIHLTGVIPQLAVIMGPTMGAPAYAATLMDLIFFNKTRSHLMVTSPAVVKKAIGEKTTMASLGGAQMHAKQTGLADFVDENIQAQLSRVKSMVSLLSKPRQEARAPINPLPTIPSFARVPFDMQTLIDALVDESACLSYKAQFGQAMICAFARISGHRVGIVANQSIKLSGAINVEASSKSSQFIRLCNRLNLPIVTLIDVPGFMPGQREEQAGLLLHGADFCRAMQTRVPRLSLVVRRCYGAAAFLMMQSNAQGGDVVLALESASINVMADDTIEQVMKTDKTQSDLSNTSSLHEANRLGLIDEIITLDEVGDRLTKHLDLVMRDV